MLTNYRRPACRAVNILNLLMEKEDGISLRTITDINQCSSHTALSDLGCLHDTWNHYVGLDYSDTQFITVTHNTGDLQLLQEILLALEPQTELLRLILELPRNSIAYYASKMCISMQSIRHQMVELEKTLNRFDLTLDLHSQNVELSGNEFEIRIFIALFYYSFRRTISMKPIDHTKYGVQTEFELKCKFPFLERFSLYTLYAAELRSIQGYWLDPSVNNQTVQGDVEATLAECVQRAQKLGSRLWHYKDELAQIMLDMGYVLNSADVEQLLVILGILLQMYNFYISKTPLKLNSSKVFMMHYEKTNSHQCHKQLEALKATIAPLTDDADWIVARFMYNVNLLFTHNIPSIELNVVVFSDRSTVHAETFISQIKDIFSKCTFHIYDDETELGGPKEDALNAFCRKHNADAIISTRTLGYEPSCPCMLINYFCTGEDVGRIFDFMYQVS